MVSFSPPPEKVIDEIKEHCNMIGALVDRARGEDGLGPEASPAHPARQTERAVVVKHAPRRSQQANPDMNDARHRGKAAMMLKHVEAVLRNKRLLLGYHDVRLEMIRELRWRGRTLPKEIEAKLSPAERDFFKAYDRLLNQYMRSGTGIGLDITADPVCIGLPCRLCTPSAPRPPNRGVSTPLLVLQVPPKDPLVPVLVVEDLGEVYFSHVGYVRLRRNTKHLVPREEAEPLIREGKLVLFE